MAERNIGVDHSTVHRWVIKVVPLFEKTFRKLKRPVGKSWRVDETYIKVKGSWKYLYRAVDKAGNTIDFLFRAKRDKAAARRFFEKAIGQNGSPETVTIDKSGSNLAALNAVNAEREMPITVRQGQVFEQHRGAGPSGHQTPNPTDARVQEFQLRARDSKWHRIDAHDQERTVERFGQVCAVCRLAILLVSFISFPTHIAVV